MQMNENIINSNEMRAMIIAGAGTGKTHHAIELAKNTVGHVLFLAFTTQAKETIQKRYTGDNASIMTIDGLAFKLMRRNGLYTDIIDKSTRTRKYGKKFDLEKIDAQHRNVGNLNKEYSEQLKKDGWVDFGIIMQLVTQLPPHRLRLNFDRVIVDECQDINAIQWHFINQILGNAQLFLVGDPRQNIFEFRGSDYSILNSYRKEATQYQLDVNYRSYQEILDVANNYSFQIDPKLNPLISSRGYGGTVNRISHSQLIPCLRECDYNQTVVIAFKNETIGILRSQLMKLGIPCKENYPLYMRKNIKDVVAVIKTMLDLKDFQFIRLLKLLPNIGDAAITAIKEMDSFETLFINLMKFSFEVSQGTCLLKIADSKKKTIHDFMFFFNENCDLYENPLVKITAVCEYLHIEQDIYYEQFMDELKNDCSPSIEGITAFINEIEVGERSQRTKNGVQFGTIHGMKGSEKPYVFFIADDFNTNQSRIEKLRLSYVACTRAQNVLYIVGVDNMYNPKLINQIPSVEEAVKKAVQEASLNSEAMLHKSKDTQEESVIPLAKPIFSYRSSDEKTQCQHRVQGCDDEGCDGCVNLSVTC